MDSIFLRQTACRVLRTCPLYWKGKKAVKYRLNVAVAEWLVELHPEVLHTPYSIVLRNNSHYACTSDHSEYVTHPATIYPTHYSMVL